MGHPPATLWLAVPKFFSIISFSKFDVAILEAEQAFTLGVETCSSHRVVKAGGSGWREVKSAINESSLFLSFHICSFHIKERGWLNHAELGLKMKPEVQPENRAHIVKA